MARFSWTDDLYTGSTLIDSDHRKLIGLVNALFETMEDGQDSARMRPALNALLTYTAEHFDREQAEMARIQYVAALAHESEHHRLLQQLAGLKQMLDAGGRLNLPAIADFLSRWLRDHILTADMKLAAVLTQQRSAAPVAPEH